MKRKGLSLIYFAFLMVLAAAALTVWTVEAEDRVHYVPEYDKVELALIFEKETLTEEDYRLIALQTGLFRAGVEELWENGRKEELLYLQQRFFAPIQYKCSASFVFYRSERIVERPQQEKEARTLERSQQQQEAQPNGKENENQQASLSGSFLPAVQDGDILVSFSGHVFGWRSGHAAIVVDAEQGKTLEAIAPGTITKICSLEAWKQYPTLALLRLKDTEQEKRAEIAAYAAENFTGIPYSLVSFCKTETVYRVQEANDFRTHCAHLVWLAYGQFGYDLDGDGGMIVTPCDLYNSEYLEIVQIYGISPGNI